MPGSVGQGGAAEESPDEQDQPQNGQPCTNRKEHVVPAGNRPFGQALTESGTHGATEVEPVALGPGGTGAAVPGAAGGAGDWRCSFRTWLTMAQRSTGA